MIHEIYEDQDGISAKDAIDAFLEGDTLPFDVLHKAVLTVSTALEDLIDRIHEISECENNQIGKTLGRDLVKSARNYDAAIHEDMVLDDFI